MGRAGEVTAEPPTVSARGRVGLATLLALAGLITAAYWVVWFSDRSLLASVQATWYYRFENAFPVADGWLTVCLVGAAVGLVRRSGWTLLFLLCGVGAGFYLLGMDVLFDAENRIWWRGGAGGVVELAINLATLCVAALVLRWTWRRREALLAWGRRDDGGGRSGPA